MDLQQAGDQDFFFPLQEFFSNKCILPLQYTVESFPLIYHALYSCLVVQQLYMLWMQSHVIDRLAFFFPHYWKWEVSTGKYLYPRSSEILFLF